MVAVASPWYNGSSFTHWQSFSLNQFTLFLQLDGSSQNFAVLTMQDRAPHADSSTCLVRGGSLPEIFIYLPRGGKFSQVEGPNRLRPLLGVKCCVLFPGYAMLCGQ